MEKTAIILHMYDDLMEGKKLSINQCCANYGFSVATFYRYLEVIRVHVWEEFFLEVIYNPREKNYAIIR